MHHLREISMEMRVHLVRREEGEGASREKVLLDQKESMSLLKIDIRLIQERNFIKRNSRHKVKPI